MKVLDPMLKGKVYLKYDGNNMSYSQFKITKHLTRMFDYNINYVQQNLLFNFRLHNNIEVAVSLISMNVYIYDRGGWVRHEDSVSNVTDILVDHEYILIKGAISYCNYIDENNRYIDPYYFDAIFYSAGNVLPKLISENANFVDFRAMDN